MLRDAFLPVIRLRRRIGTARMLRYLAETAAAYSAYGLFKILPLDAASAFGGWLMRQIGPRLKRTEKVVLPQLALAFPEMDARERHRTMLAMWDNLGRIFGEYAHLDKIWSRVTLVGREYFEEVRDNKYPAIFFTAHIGNWEIASIGAIECGVPLHVVYRAPNNPGVESLLRRARRAGSEDRLIKKGPEGARAILSVLRHNGAVGMLIDQKLTGAPLIPFFGRPALTAPTVAIFAQRNNARLYPARIERLAGAHFRLTVEPPLQVPDTGDRARDTEELLTAVNQRLESWIRVHPGQWLWTHRRWDS